MIEKKAKESIRKAALKNALDYGKAREGTVLASVLSEFPELRSNIKELSESVGAEVKKINKMTKAEIEEEAGAYREEFEQKEKEKAARTAKPKMELEGAVKGKFATRFPPAPNGYMHIGHAKAAFMEREFTDIYEGKLALYFDDTNPETDKQEYADSFKKDLKWLGIGFDSEYYASDNIEMLYDYAVTMIKNGNAYVCLCPPEEIKENRGLGKACGHKNQDDKENLRLWKEMIGKKSNSGILRFNGKMSDLNTAMRDPTLFRIKKEPHYRQGSRYAVWPTYDFNTPIIDSLKGVTDAMRSKEYELRDELYYKVLDVLGLRKPKIRTFARLEIENNITSKRQLKALMAEGKISGWDDPRLVTIAGLRRRGILPAAIREFVLRFGMSKTNSRVGIEMLLAENRKIIEGRARRLFFVEKPMKIKVKGIPEDRLNVKIRSHPNAEMGYREYKLNGEFFINAYDAINLKNGDQVRLKDAFDIKIEKKGENATEAKYIEEVGKGTPKLQWVNEGNYARGRALMIGDLLDGENFNKNSIREIDGLVEGSAKELSEGDVVQFERVGFFKLDSKKEMSFISL